MQLRREGFNHHLDMHAVTQHNCQPKAEYHVLCKQVQVAGSRAPLVLTAQLPKRAGLARHSLCKIAASNEGSNGNGSSSSSQGSNGSSNGSNGNRYSNNGGLAGQNLSSSRSNGGANSEVPEDKKTLKWAQQSFKVRVQTCETVFCSGNRKYKQSNVS